MSIEVSEPQRQPPYTQVEFEFEDELAIDEPADAPAKPAKKRRAPADYAERKKSGLHQLASRYRAELDTLKAQRIQVAQAQLKHEAVCKSAVNPDEVPFSGHYQTQLILLEHAKRSLALFEELAAERIDEIRAFVIPERKPAVKKVKVEPVAA